MSLASISWNGQPEGGSGMGTGCVNVFFFCKIQAEGQGSPGKPFSKQKQWGEAKVKETDPPWSQILLSPETA